MTISDHTQSFNEYLGWYKQNFGYHRSPKDLEIMTGLATPYCLRGEIDAKTAFDALYGAICYLRQTTNLDYTAIDVIRLIVSQYGGLHSEYIAPSTGELLTYEAQHINDTAPKDKEIIWALCAPLTLNSRTRMNANLATTIVHGAISLLRQTKGIGNYDIRDVIDTIDQTYSERGRTQMLRLLKRGT
ncbi:MAG: hypothetical protein J4428_05200 [Candidatus Aenigmarchaeota archaeon]|nr:hypothetical protein [Candidatus Aenigmarchaeota archaeon]